jgi:hypothetical protein
MCKISGKGNFEGNGEIFMDRLLYSGPTVRNIGSDCQNTSPAGTGLHWTPPNLIAPACFSKNLGISSFR